MALIDGLVAEYLCLRHHPTNCLHLSWYRLLVEVALALNILVATLLESPFFLASWMTASMRSDGVSPDLREELLPLVGAEDLS